MSLIPDITELLARARADLRMGVPVVLSDDSAISVVAVAAETLSPQRLADLRGLSGDLVVAITGRRAETLKARAYDGDIARIEVPATADLTWLLGVADPSDDLNKPMKGPLNAQRDGDATLHRSAIQIAKSAGFFFSL